MIVVNLNPMASVPQRRGNHMFTEIPVQVENELFRLPA